jgi:hypothetical protein
MYESLPSLQPGTLLRWHGSNWIADGTFYVAPNIFTQSYTIHAVIDQKFLL